MPKRGAVTYIHSIMSTIQNAERKEAQRLISPNVQSAHIIL